MGGQIVKAKDFIVYVLRVNMYSNGKQKFVSSMKFSYQSIILASKFPSGPGFGYLLLFPEGIKRHETTKASSLIKYSTHVCISCMVIS